MNNLNPTIKTINFVWLIMIGVVVGMFYTRSIIEHPDINAKSWITIIVDIFTVIIALWAILYTSIQAKNSQEQTELNKEHNYLSVRPYIVSQANRTKESPINFEIVNKGLGPAIITKMLFNIEYNGKTTEDESLGRLVSTCGIPHLKTTGYTPNTGYCVAAGEKVELVSFEPPDDPSVKIETESEKEDRHTNELYFVDNIYFEINYMSMYEEENHTLIYERN